MKEVKVDSECGRFQGVQFDLEDALEYGAEVVLTVRCKVHESTLRSTRAGDVRRIHVLKPVEVTTLPSSSSEVLPPKLALGKPVVLPAEIEAEDEAEAYLAELEAEAWDEAEPVEIVATPRPMRITRDNNTPVRAATVKDTMLAAFLAGD